MTLPAVGACTCASGSQVWSGNIGTLIAKLNVKARNIQIWIPIGIPGAIAYRRRRSVVNAPPGSEAA